MGAVAPVLGVVSSAVGIVGTVKGMSDAKKQQDAVKQQGQQNVEQIRAHNEDSIKLLEKQIEANNTLRTKINDDMKTYTRQKGMEALALQSGLGYERLLFEADQAQQTANRMGAQQAEVLGLASEKASEEYRLFDERWMDERGQAGKERNQTLTEAVERYGNTVTKANFTHAQQKIEIGMRDQAAVEEHAADQALRSFKKHFGIGTVVASAAARGVVGGGMAAIKGIAREDAILQAASDNNLKLQRGLYALAGAAADFDREMALREGGQEYKNTVARSDLAWQRMEMGFAADREALVSRNTFALKGLQMQQAHEMDDFVFNANKAVQSGYLGIQQGLKAGMSELEVKIKDLDFNYGIENAKAAVDDAFRMEKAKIDAKHDVSMANIRDSYNNTMAGLQTSATMWQGVSMLSNSLFNAYQNISPMFPTRTGTSYTGGGMIGNNAIGGTGMLGGGV